MARFRFHKKQILFLKHLVWVIAFALIPKIIPAQQFSKTDSGWVSIFNGIDFDGMYSRMYKQPVQDVPDNIFTIQTDSSTSQPMIHVDSGGGHIGTDKEYSHFRMRVEYKFGPNTSSTANAGLMYHLTEDWPRMAGNWPRSIECQMKKNETGDAFSIQDVTYDIPVESGSRQYQENSTTFTTSWSGNHRQVWSLSHKGLNPFLNNEWNTMEIIVRGSDSAIHRVNNVDLLKLYNIRIPDTSGGNQELIWNKGKLAVQAENSEIMYKNWEVMELHPDAPENFAYGIMAKTEYSYYNFFFGPYPIVINWDTIGNFDFVKLEYDSWPFSQNDWSNEWNIIADSIPNKGKYLWNVSQDFWDLGLKRIRISSHPWVTPGVTQNFFIDSEGSVHPKFFQNLHFLVGNLSYTLNYVGNFKSITIFNSAGKLIRILPIKNLQVRWDGNNSKDQRVNLGIYFVRLGKSSFKIIYTL